MPWVGGDAMGRSDNTVHFRPIALQYTLVHGARARFGIIHALRGAMQFTQSE